MTNCIKEIPPLQIPLQDLRSATNNFEETNLIGKGGFGKVYQGEILLSEVRTMVAIKRLDRSYGQGNPEFRKEITLLSRYKHPNLVALLGFCDENGECILVYEYLSNKSLDLHLSSTNISWLQRLNICLEAAKGLQFLHEPAKGSTERVLHRDIKSANILLDQHWSPKIADFGLSRLGPANQQVTFLHSNPVGTPGYCDPFYVLEGLLTKESDVYSFGVVLFEVLCGRPSVQINYHDNRRFLGRLSRKCYEEKKMNTIIHIGLKDNISPKCLERFSAIAYQCLHIDHERRPSMGKVIQELIAAYNYQAKFENHELLIEEPLDGNTIETETETVRVKFQLHRKCSFGQNILVTGNDRVLGLWDPNNAIRLTWSEGHLWSVDLDIPTAKCIKFKFIMKKSNGEIVWQPGPDRVLACFKTNKMMALSEDWEDPDSRWIIESEATLNQDIQMVEASGETPVEPLVSISGVEEPKEYAKSMKQGISVPIPGLSQYQEDSVNVASNDEPESHNASAMVSTEPDMAKDLILPQVTQMQVEGPKVKKHRSYQVAD